MRKILKTILLVVFVFFLLYHFAPGSIMNTSLFLTTQLNGFKEKTASLDGKEYYYFDNQKEDLPALVFVHGYSDRKESWFPYALSFKKDYRVIILDLMGHGDNEKDWNVRYDFSDQADFIQRMCKPLGLDKFHLVGISMGGAVVGKFAYQYPEYLHSVSFISSAGINGNARLSEVEQYMEQFKGTEIRKEKIPIVPAKLDNASLDLFRGFIFENEPFMPKKLFKYYLKLQNKDRDFYLKILSDFLIVETGKFKHPLDPNLAEIRVPSCVIWGKQDPLLDVSSVAVFEQGLANLKAVTIIDNCGHASIVEQPKETVQALKNFLSTF